MGVARCSGSGTWCGVVGVTHGEVWWEWHMVWWEWHVARCSGTWCGVVGVAHGVVWWEWHMVRCGGSGT